MKKRARQIVSALLATILLCGGMPMAKIEETVQAFYHRGCIRGV